jgi:hypothetical protein
MNNAGMGVTEHNGEFPEVLVERHKDAISPSQRTPESHRLPATSASRRPRRRHDRVLRARSPRRARRRRRAVASCSVNRGLDTLPSHEPARKNQAGLNVLGLKVRIALQNGLGTIARRKHAEYVLDRNATPPNNGLPAKDLWVNCNAGQKVCFGHMPTLITAQGNSSLYFNAEEIRSSMDRDSVSRCIRLVKQNGSDHRGIDHHHRGSPNSS